MDYKILEVRVIFLHDQDEYTLHVAIQSAEGYWRAFKKRQLRFDYAAAQLTARSGTKLKPEEAASSFPELAKTLQYEA